MRNNSDGLITSECDYNNRYNNHSVIELANDTDRSQLITIIITIIIIRHAIDIYIYIYI